MIITPHFLSGKILKKHLYNLDCTAVQATLYPEGMFSLTITERELFPRGKESIGIKFMSFNTSAHSHMQKKSGNEDP